MYALHGRMARGEVSVQMVVKRLEALLHYAMFHVTCFATHCETSYTKKFSKCLHLATGSCD